MEEMSGWNVRSGCLGGSFQRGGNLRGNVQGTYGSSCRIVSLHIAVKIWTTLVNTYTNTQTAFNKQPTELNTNYTTLRDSGRNAAVLHFHNALGDGDNFVGMGGAENEI